MTKLEIAKQKYPYLFEEQVCPVCGKKFYFNNIQIKCRIPRLEKGLQILIACCPSHLRKMQNQIFGSPFARKECIEKSFKTKQIRYNNKNFNNRAKACKTCNDKYGVDNPSKIKNVLYKIKQTKLNNIDKNGLNSFQRASLKIVKKRYSNINEQGLNSYQTGGLKARNTMLNDIDSKGLNGYDRRDIKSEETKTRKYNNPYYNNFEKAIETNLLKRGVKIPIQSKEVLENYKKLYKEKTGYDFPFKNPDVIAKIKQTNINNLGVDNPFKSDKIKQKIKLQLQDIKQRQYETMKRNKTYQRPSKPEDECYNLLLTKFSKNDIERPYMNDEYPFKCDFYIKSLDLYIECHFSQFHQYKPFDKNNKQDLIKLLCLQLKSLKLRKCKNKKNQYDFMIYTWTDLDPRKLQTFKQNNLNYKIFYNKEDFNEWFNFLN